MKTTKKPQSGWSAPGFEPGTSRMRVSCGTTEPPRSVRNLLFFNVGLNDFEKQKMFTKLPEFVACNLKCGSLVLQRLVKCSVNDTEIQLMVTDVLMGLKAKSSTFREFCERCMKSLCLSISNTDSESCSF